MKLWIRNHIRSKSDAVHNDFHQPRGIFSLFDGLRVKDMAETFKVPNGLVNGHTPNGDEHQANEKSNGAAA